MYTAAGIGKRHRRLAVEHIMVRLRHNLGLALLLATGLCLASGKSPAQTPAPVGAAPAKSSHSQKEHVHRKKTAPAAEIPQMPPTPPRVTYQNGLLTIDAKNSTLSQVLRTVQVQTGASVEMPSSAANERVTMQVGPGRPRDVVNTLLNGSKFNYIILGMIDNPGGVQKVILTTRQNAPATVNTAQNTPTSPQYQPPPDETRDEEMTGPEAEAENPPETRHGLVLNGKPGPRTSNIQAA